MAERARREAGKWSNMGGQLRIEVERGRDDDPTPQRFRELLDAAVAIAELNASINT